MREASSAGVGPNRMCTDLRGARPAVVETARTSVAAAGAGWHCEAAGSRAAVPARRTCAALPRSPALR